MLCYPVSPALCASFFVSAISGPGYTPKDPHWFSSCTYNVSTFVSPISGPGYTPKDPHLPTKCIIKFAYATRCNAAPVIASTCLFAFLIGLLLSQRVFLLACPPLSGTGAIALPALLLHVFVNSFVVHVQKLCDLTLTSLTDGRSARDLPKQHRTKKNSIRFNLVFGRRHLVHGCGASMVSRCLNNRTSFYLAKQGRCESWSKPESGCSANGHFLRFQ